MNGWSVPIPGFPGYTVTEDGAIWSGKPARKLKPYPNKWGYDIVTLCRNGRKYRRSVHSLVALAFFGPRPAGLQVHHVDHDKRNNRADNLRYVSASENNRLSFAAGRRPKADRIPGFRDKKSRAMVTFALRLCGFGTGDTARIVGLSPASVCDIVSGRTWPEAKRAFSHLSTMEVAK